MQFPHFPGWHLIGQFPKDCPDVGSWLLTDSGEAMLLEVPEEIAVADVKAALTEKGCHLRYVTASHDHWDHLDRNSWGYLAEAFPRARFIHPASVRGDRWLQVGNETVWLVAAPKHSLYDVVTVFRGVAMTGDIETGTLDSVSKEVPMRVRRRSMDRLRVFPDRCGYHVHSTVSAHLTSVLQGVDWQRLFKY
jgi:hypothetical protein